MSHDKIWWEQQRRFCKEEVVYRQWMLQAYGGRCIQIHNFPKKSGHVTYGDNNKGKIIGVGKIGTSSSTPIQNVLLVEGLKHSLLSVSQLCDRGYNVSFDSEKMCY